MNLVLLPISSLKNMDHLASCPARQRRLWSLRQMRQDLSWALARSLGREPGMSAVGILLRCSLFRPRYGTWM
jgi:hypothetical protein